VDRAVFQHCSRPSGLPLVLAALPEHHHLFREVSHNPQLVAEGIRVNPGALAVGELRDRAWQVMKPHHDARLAALGDEFAPARARALGSADVEQVAAAAWAGKVATLLIAADRRIAGRLDGETGQVRHDGLSHPQVDDLLDDLGALVVKMGGNVLAIPEERMPSRTGLAAIYRY
jgi:hypothetical protein